MLTVNAVDSLVVDSDFKQSLPWKYGPSWVVPVGDRNRRNQLYANNLSLLLAQSQCVCSASVPREWTGSEHKQALLPCLTGVHCGTGMEPRVQTEDWTRLRTVRDNSTGEYGQRLAVCNQCLRCIKLLAHLVCYISFDYTLLEEYNPRIESHLCLKHDHCYDSLSCVSHLLKFEGIWRKMLWVCDVEDKVLPWTPSSPPRSGSGRDQTWRWCR